MRVKKLSASWGGKGLGAEVSAWMPEVTFETLEMLAHGRAITELQASVTAAIRDVIKECGPLANRTGEIEVRIETFDDETGELVE